jgi:hypothetical protein
VLTVFGQPVRVTRGSPGGAQPRVVSADPKGFAAAAAGASGPQRASGAGRAERGPSGAADRAGQPVGAGRGAVVLVDGEVLDGEPARDGPGHWCLGSAVVAVVLAGVFVTQVGGAWGFLAVLAVCFFLASAGDSSAMPRRMPVSQAIPASPPPASTSARLVVTVREFASATDECSLAVPTRP